MKKVGKWRLYKIISAASSRLTKALQKEGKSHRPRRIATPPSRPRKPEQEGNDNRCGRQRLTIASAEPSKRKGSSCFEDLCRQQRLNESLHSRCRANSPIHPGTLICLTKVLTSGRETLTRQPVKTAHSMVPFQKEGLMRLRGAGLTPR